MWKTVQLGDLCEILDTRRKPITKKDRIHGEYPYYGATGIVDWVVDYIFDEELVLIGEDGAKWDAGEKTAFIVDGKYWVNNHAHVVKPNTEKLLNKWLTYYLCGIDLKPWVTGMTVPKLNQGQLKSIPIPLPPLAEQERIVAKLDAAFAEIDEAISSAESKESEVQALKTSILSKLLNNKSNGWESSYLEGVSSFISRGISPKYIESGGVRVLNQKCIRNHRINYDLARRHDIDLKKVSEERFIRLGDILINSTGQGTLGRVAQVRKEPNELTTIDSHITIVRPKSELFYLDYFGYAAIAIEKIIQDAGQGTSGQTELAKSKVQNDFQICFPRSFSDQEAEVKKLDIVFEEIEIALKNLTKSKTNLYALKSAILSQELQSSEAA